ncbi:MAG: M14 family metallopeptidase [Ignavibacteriaceae bacterium]
MKRKLITILLLLVTQVVLPQTQDEWITYFERSGFTETPNYHEAMEYYQKLADFSPLAEFKSFGVSPQGRELKFLIVSKEKVFKPTKAKEIHKPIILIINGIHAGEIGGKDASMLLLREILITKERRSLIDSVTILIVPIFNVDGHERMGKYNRINQNGPEEMGWRTTAQNLNLNRDWMKADSPEMRAMLKLFSDWLPDFTIDTHATDGADYQYTITYSVEKFSNIYSGTANWLKEKFIPAIEKGVQEKGFLVYPYIYLKKWREGLDGGIIDWASTPRFSTGYAALQNRPSLLIETHMIKPYKDRVYSTKAMLETTIEFVNTSAAELIELNLEADVFSAENLSKQKKYLHVGFKESGRYEMIDFKGYEYYRDSSKISGSNKLVYTDVKKNFKIKHFNDIVPLDSVMLPKAYLIPKEWSKLVDILEIHGIQVNYLKVDSIFEVTKYRFKNVKFANSSYEGRQRVDLEYDLIREKRTVPSGTFYIPLNQRTIRIIANLLEPKSSDSFIRWGFMNAIFERKEYFEKYVMEKIAEQMLNKDVKLRKEFEEKLNEDEEFRNNPEARLNFFYKRSPYQDKNYQIYPVMRID